MAPQGPPKKVKPMGAPVPKLTPVTPRSNCPVVYLSSVDEMYITPRPVYDTSSLASGNSYVLGSSGRWECTFTITRDYLTRDRDLDAIRTLQEAFNADTPVLLVWPGRNGEALITGVTVTSRVSGAMKYKFTARGMRMASFDESYKDFAASVRRSGISAAEAAASMRRFAEVMQGKGEAERDFAAAREAAREAAARKQRQLDEERERIARGHRVLDLDEPQSVQSDTPPKRDLDIE